MTDTTNRLFTATFTLEQDGIHGMVTPKLAFDPMIDPSMEEVPGIYEYMSDVSLQFLRFMKAIDSNNNPILDHPVFEQLELGLSTSETYDEDNQD